MDNQRHDIIGLLVSLGIIQLSALGIKLFSNVEISWFMVFTPIWLPYLVILLAVIWYSVQRR